MSPLLRFWKNIRRATATRRTPANRRATTRFRPRLEALEDRLAPAVLVWTGATNNSLWSDPGNWEEGKTPYTTPEVDAVVFPRSAAPRLSIHDGPPTTLHNIEFLDSGYTITGGDLILDMFGVVCKAPGGTNTLDVRTLTMAGEPNLVPKLYVDFNNNLVVRSSLAGNQVEMLVGESFHRQLARQQQQ